MFSKLGGSDGHDIIAEAHIDFTHELAVRLNMWTRICCIGMPETVQQNHICVAVITPARVPDSIKKLASSVLEAMKVMPPEVL